MEDFVLKAKAWKTLLVLSVCYVFSWFSRGGGMQGMLQLLGFCVYCIWIALLGNSLSQLGKSPRNPPVWWFVTNVVLSTAPVVSSFLATPNFVVTTSIFSAQGMWVIPLLYLLVAYVHMHWFVASAMSTAEQGKKPELIQIVVIALCIMLWPLGIWILRPRLNRIYTAFNTASIGPTIS